MGQADPKEAGRDFEKTDWEKTYEEYREILADHVDYDAWYMISRSGRRPLPGSWIF